MAEELGVADADERRRKREALLAELATRSRHTCAPAGGSTEVTFTKLTDVTAFQAEAFRGVGLKPASH